MAAGGQGGGWVAPPAYSRSQQDVRRARKPSVPPLTSILPPHQTGSDMALEDHVKYMNVPVGRLYCVLTSAYDHQQ